MLRETIDGVKAYAHAVQLVFRLRLWFYVIVPGLISLFLGLAIFGAAWGTSDDIGAWLLSFYPFDWGRAALEKIAQVFGGIFVIALGLILFKHLVLAITSPIMSLLSEKVERSLRGYSPDAPFSLKQALRDLARGLRLALRNLVRELFYTLLLLFLGLILPVLAPFLSAAIFLVQAFYAGFGNMDFALERHFGVRQSIAFGKKHRGLAIGNGAVFLLLLFTGIGFLFALPLSTIAATKETVKRLPGNKEHSQLRAV